MVSKPINKMKDQISLTDRKINRTYKGETK
jgi:hypothetical protein